MSYLESQIRRLFILDSHGVIRRWYIRDDQLLTRLPTIYDIGALQYYAFLGSRVSITLVRAVLTNQPYVIQPTDYLIGFYDQYLDAI